MSFILIPLTSWIQEDGKVEIVRRGGRSRRRRVQQVNQVFPGGRRPNTNLQNRRGCSLTRKHTGFLGEAGEE